MEILSHESSGVRVVSPAGSIDALTAGELAAFLAQLAGQPHLVIDLGQVDFMSSAGLRVILVSAKEARQQGGDLRLAAPQANVQRTLKMAGFTHIAKVFDTVEAAVASFASPGP